MVRQAHHERFVIIGSRKIKTFTHKKRKNLNLTMPLFLAVIDEPACIGCTRCIKACPENAIIGKRREIHQIINELCTGCALCLPPCPVDCIDLVLVKSLQNQSNLQSAPQISREKSAPFNVPKQIVHNTADKSALHIPEEKDDKENRLAAALLRAREKRLVNKTAGL